MTPQPRNVVRYAYLVASVAGVLFFAMSVALLGIWPSRVLQKQIDTMSPDHPLGLSASEQRGRRIYGREGCAYCHSQQVRYVDADMARFGAPTLAWETRFDYPHLWGTRRIGPDLAREAGSHPTDWHMQHLLAPRSIVADSVMPAYPWLFDGASDRPTQDARDLVAYLETLGRARELASPEGEAKAHKACNCDNDEMTMMPFHAKQLNANPARARRTGDAPLLWSVLAVYVVAKVFEFADGQIFAALHVISGHTLKHVTAALGVYFFLLAARGRYANVAR